MEGWESFYVAEVGAAAVLAGLIFVGLSINLDKILAMKRLPNRAAQALFMLMAALILASLMLLPGESAQVKGVLIFLGGLVTWIFVSLVDSRIWGEADAEYRRYLPMLIAINQVCIIPYILSGILLFFNQPAGLYFLAFGILLSFCKGILDAWVLLVEINR
jgi:modulator of FtsH protease